VIKAGRGGFDAEKSLETLRKMRVNMLFVIGGDGTLSAAHQLFEAAREANANVSIVGVPKSIDNDVLFFDRTFGFDSAVACASGIIKNGWVEATSCAKGVGIVKLMGRDAGFVAAHASLASGLADMCLIPEVSFRLEDLLAHVETTLKRKGHMVIVVAEGAGQELIAGSNDEHDATGHKKCTLRIRVWSDVDSSAPRRHLRSISRLCAQVLTDTRLAFELSCVCGVEQTPISARTCETR